MAEELSWVPSPIDTAGIEIDASITDLAEQLAAHAHDLWAQRRFGEGWTYGPARDDVRKTNPDLVPYPDLPENEKEYDRVLALGTIKAILRLGYRILPPE